MPRFLLILIFSAFCVSCASIDSTDNDKIVAENTVLKRKISRIERENSVIRKENTDFGGLIKEKDATLEKRAEDLAAFKIKYKTDMQLLNNKFNNLKITSDLQKKQSEERIKLLNDQNSSLEKQIAEKVKALTEEMRINTEKYNSEREKTKKDFAKHETDLIKRIEELNSLIEIKDREIAELKDISRKSVKQDGSNTKNPVDAPSETNQKIK